MSEKRWTDDERSEAFERGLKTMEGIALELYRRGREEAREELEAVKRERDEWRDKFLALNQTAGELCNACGWAFKIPGESCRCEAVKERDEARAEVEKLSESAKAAWEAESVMREQRDRYHAEWKQARQEVERLRAEAAPMNEHFTAGYRDGYRDAYRRGAEAMREACAQWFREHDESFELTVDACHDVIADMPIPEEP